MNEKNKTKQSTKDIIKENFLKLYNQKPINQISVSEIILASNCSRSTFYFYYEDIYALFRDCEQDAVRIIEDGLPDIVLFSVGQNFEKYVDAFVDFLNRMSSYSDILLSLLNGSQNDNFRKVWFESIRRNYMQTISFSRQYSETQKRLMSELFAAGMLRLLTNWFTDGCRESSEEIAYVSAHALFKGML